VCVYLSGVKCYCGRVSPLFSDLFDEALADGGLSGLLCQVTREWAGLALSLSLCRRTEDGTNQPGKATGSSIGRSLGVTRLPKSCGSVIVCTHSAFYTWYAVLLETSVGSPRNRIAPPITARERAHRGGLTSGRAG
jgi:hypothetical protein